MKNFSWSLLDTRQWILAVLSVIRVKILSFSADLTALLASRQHQTHNQNAGNQKWLSLLKESCSHSLKNVPCQLITLLVKQKGDVIWRCLTFKNFFPSITDWSDQPLWIKASQSYQHSLEPPLIFECVNEQALPLHEHIAGPAAGSFDSLPYKRTWLCYPTFLIDRRSRVSVWEMHFISLFSFKISFVLSYFSKCKVFLLFSLSL